MVKVSDYVAEFVAGLGVKHVFLLPGGGSMHLVDSVSRRAGLKYVCNLHEQACAIAAEAYSQYTGGFGVALVTTGPGGTNAMTGLAAAWVDSTPCLFLSGQVKRPDLSAGRGVRMMGFQEVDIVSLVKPVTKYAVTVTEPRDIRYHLEKAAYLARAGRPGPVWVDIPLDVQASEVSRRDLAAYSPASAERPAEPKALRRQVAEAIRLLNRAERPVILVGHGVRQAGALPEFSRLIELLKVPVLTTWRALDFLPESHPLFAGRPGAAGQRGANFTQQNSDWLLTLGARLDLGQTAYSHKNFARAARKVMVDIDPCEIAKMTTAIDVPVCADAKAFLAEFLRQRGALAAADRRGWLARCLGWKRRYPVALPEYWKERGHVNDYVLLEVLSEEMRGTDLLVPGSSGACSERTMQAFKAKRGMRVLNSNGLGAMGFALPAAIGACIASGGRRTVSIDGDGGFQLNIQELETIARLKLPIKLFVLNNQGYASIRTSQRAYFAGRYAGSDPSSGLTVPDTLRVARAYGLASLRIRGHAGLRAGVRKALVAKGPVIVDVLGAKDQPTAPRVTSFQRPDGSMVSRPMEDLAPFLDREEFRSNMIVPPLPED